VIDLLVATTNPGKFAEVQAFLNSRPMRICSVRDLKDPPAVVENGAIFEANALKKARTLADFSGLLTLADDSGLEVDALGGAPGIYSARYCGREGDDAENNRKLLRELTGVAEALRTSRFVCALALCAPEGFAMADWTVRESCDGLIAFELAGNNGFGYDPLFYYAPLGKTFGEIDRKTKLTVSHRGKALKKLAQALPRLVDLALEP